MRKVFTENLPRYNNGISWIKSVGKRVNFVYDNIMGEIVILSYENYYLTINYKNDEFKIHCSSFEKCCLGKLLKTKTNDFKINIGDIFKDDKRDLIIIDKKYIHDGSGRTWKAYKYKCNKCGFDCGEHYRNGEYREEHWIVEGDLIQGAGCSCCCKPSRIVVQGINDMYTTDYWMVRLGVDEIFAKSHAPQSNKKAPCKCPHCDSTRFVITGGVYRTKSIGCTCGDGYSYPEKIMNSILKQLNVEFKTEYSPTYLNLKGSQKRSDFYIPSLNLVIETDGEIGHKNGRLHGKSSKTLEEHIKIDKWKDEQHLKHGIKTIRINCFESDIEYIRNNILKSELVNYFSFDNINWNKANEYAWFSNLRKEVCDYWNNKEEYESTKDLAKIFNINRSTIIRYLTIGNDLKWCVYDAKEERTKSSSKVGKSKGISIEIFKDEESLGVFDSAAEISRISMHELGVNLISTCITSTLNPNRTTYKKSYKGFTFKYIEDNQSA